MEYPALVIYRVAFFINEKGFFIKAVIGNWLVVQDNEKITDRTNNFTGSIQVRECTVSYKEAMSDQMNDVIALANR